MTPQFRLRTLFLATLYVACIVAWVQWNWPTDERWLRHYRPWRLCYPGLWGLVACAVMIAVGIARLRGAAARTCWTWLLCGATIALANHVESILHVFSCMGYCDECDFRDEMIINRVQSLTLPVVVGAPVAFALLSPIVGRLPRGDRWSAITFFVAASNVVLLNTLLVLSFSMSCDLRRAEGRARYMANQLSRRSESASDGCCCTSVAVNGGASAARSVRTGRTD